MQIQWPDPILSWSVGYSKKPKERWRTLPPVVILIETGSQQTCRLAFIIRGEKQLSHSTTIVKWNGLGEKE